MSYDKILAIETATNICSIAYQNNEGEIFEKRTERKGSHSELLFLFIRELMQEHDFGMSDLNSFLVSSGPGSYTGLRIAASAVKGMLFGLEVPVYAGNTLAGFANAAESGSVHAVINARRNHLYHQKFNKENDLKHETESRILELNEIEELLSPGDKIIGTGIQRLAGQKMAQLDDLGESIISAEHLLSLFNSSSRDLYFEQTTAEDLESNYLSSSQVNNAKFK